jgi:mRNA-degrading endonuclease YafQ of YafQ-DinJ toxin-antitoxin module
MIELVWDEAFARAIKKWQKKHPELTNHFKERLRLFSEQPFHPSLKNTQFERQLKGLFGIQYYLRVPVGFQIYL